MWFDPQAALSALRRGEAAEHPATAATSATQPAPRRLRVAEGAEVAARPSPDIALPDAATLALALDAFVERVAIRVVDGGQSEAEAVAAALAETAPRYGIAPLTFTLRCRRPGQ